jgi:hypothetical protein
MYEFYTRREIPVYQREQKWIFQTSCAPKEFYTERYGKIESKFPQQESSGMCNTRFNPQPLKYIPNCLIIFGNGHMSYNHS